jgi:hypothetical protein
LEQSEINRKAGGSDENEKNNVKLPYFHGALLAYRLERSPFYRLASRRKMHGTKKSLFAACR